MPLAEQNGLCLSQRMSQVQLGTPVHNQQNGGAAFQEVQPQGREQPGRPTWGLEDDSQDVLCSQDFFCTPDYVTPVEQQFDVDLSSKKGNKENVRPQRSPIQFSPMRSKRPRPAPPQAPCWSQQESGTSSQNPLSDNIDMSQDPPDASENNGMEHSFNFDLGVSSQGIPDDASSGDRMVLSGQRGRADFAGLAAELQSKAGATEQLSQEGFAISKPMGRAPAKPRQPAFHAGSTGGGKATQPMKFGTGGSQFAAPRASQFNPSANAFRGHGAPRPGGSSGRPTPGPGKGRLGSQLLANNPAAERSKKGPLILENWAKGAANRSSQEESRAAGTSQFVSTGPTKAARVAHLSLVKNKLILPCVKNPFLGTEEETEPGCNKSRFTDVPPSTSATRYKEDFHEIREIGRGNFSRVFKVRRRFDGCLYAMKRSIKALYHEPEKKQALMEVQALAAAGSHPHVVRYYNAWFESDLLYIQTELCERSLQVKQGDTQALGEQQLVTIMWQMAKALHHLHHRGIAHLDLKPDNIYVLDGEYKLGDFGRAVRLAEPTGVEEGDSRYMPLEILNCGSKCDLTKVDLFSLGATIYELARAQELPKSGKDYQELRRGKLLPMPQVSPRLRNLITMLLHLDPTARPSAADVLEHAQLLKK